MSGGGVGLTTPVTRIHKNSSTNTPTWLKIAAIAIASAVVLWIVFLISWILFKGSDIGTPRTAPAALIVANERMLQMVQWTIATILTLGGALIGLNWYQSERRYQDDKRAVDETLAEVQALRDELEERFKILAEASVESLAQLAMQEIIESARPAYHPMPIPVEHFISILRSEDQNPVHRLAAIRLIVEEARILKIRGEMTDAAIRPFRDAYADIAARHGGFAKQLAEILIVPNRPND